MAKQQSLDSHYIMNIVMPLVLYTPESRAVRQGEVQFKDAYSPNNIRKIAIAPNGVVVYYHVPVNGQSKKKVTFSSQILTECQYMSGYKPIISLLKSPYVCSSIEEIVFILNSSDGGYLTSSEQWTSTEKGLGDYKRLRDIVLYNGTLEQYLAEDNSPFSDKLSMSDTTFIHEEDWFENYGYRPKYYLVDENLKKHFEKIKSKYIADKKNAAQNAKNEERVKSITEEFRKKYNEFVQFYSCYKKLIKVQESDGIRCIGTPVSSIIQPSDIAFKLYKFKGCEEYKKLASIFTESASSDKEAIQKNTEILNQKKVQIYQLMLKALDKILSDQTDNNPDSEYAGTIKKYLSKAYFSADDFATKWGITLEKVSPKMAMSNICADICMLTLAEKPNSSVVEKYKPEYWTLQ